jgi:hypothetical protein
MTKRSPKNKAKVFENVPIIIIERRKFFSHNKGGFMDVTTLLAVIAKMLKDKVILIEDGYAVPVKNDYKSINICKKINDLLDLY